MAIDRFIKKCDDSVIQECVEKTDAANYAIENMQEGRPYTIDKTILDENIYIWSQRFIDRVLLSISTTIVQNFSNKEKDLLINLHKPHPSDILKVYLIKQIQNKLKEII